MRGLCTSVDEARLPLASVGDIAGDALCRSAEREEVVLDVEAALRLLWGSDDENCHRIGLRSGEFGTKIASGASKGLCTKSICGDKVNGCDVLKD